MSMGSSEITLLPFESRATYNKDKLEESEINIKQESINPSSTVCMPLANKV